MLLTLVDPAAGAPAQGRMLVLLPESHISLPWRNAYPVFSSGFE